MENNQSNPQETKNPILVVIEKQFESLLVEINGRFEKAGDQVMGLSTWLRAQLQIVNNKVRRVEIGQTIIDVCSTSILELMLEKKIITAEEFEAKNKEVAERKSANAPKSEQK